MKHNGRFQRIRRSESVLLDVDGVIVVLPVVVGCDKSSVRIEDRQHGIAERIAYAERTERWAKGADNHGPASHVSNDESTDEHVIACTYETAPADVPQLGVKSRGGDFVHLGQADPLGPVLTSNHYGVGARGQVCL